MKPKTIDKESIEYEKSVSRLQEVVGYEDSTPVTKQMILSNYHQDWKDHEEGKTICDEDMMKWLKEEG